MARAAPAAVMPPSPAPLTPSGLLGDGEVLGGDEPARRHVHGRGHQVVHEARGLGLSVLVVDELLQQRAADALGQTARHLALDDHGVDLAADVFHHEVVEDFDHAGFPVHLHRHHVDAVGKRPLVGGEEVLFRDARSETLGQRRPGQRQTGQGGEVQAPLRRSPDADAAVRQLQVAGVDLQLRSRQPQELVLDLAARAHRGAAAHDGAAAGVAAVAEGHLGGVAVHHPHVVDGHAHLVGDDLAQGGGDALPHGVDAAVEHHAAVVADLHPGVLPGADAAGLHEAADAHAHGPAFRLGGCAALPKLLVAHVPQRRFELPRQVAAVVDHVVERVLAVVVGHLLGPDQVAPPQFRGIETEAAGGHVQQPLAHEVGLVAAGAPVGAHRGLVGEHAPGTAVIVLDAQRTPQHGR